MFDLYELEETHNGTTRLSNLYVRQKAGSNVLLNGMTLTGGTTRNSTRVLLAGENASLDLCGMAIADRNQHVDMPRALSPASSLSVPARSTPMPAKPTATSAPPATPACTPSPSWKSMPMT